ncbi:uncharacterized protein LOC111697745 isoform X2 [Eurytemora carolleeae]|uniref:uncharacterized protein LOC111697745 isoform X2 n=1 Tax=Eurytemora carolleeae TaxID=1294199 RepID=UPI000C78DCE7|nr:uncharacterized protein LOC111697745 isoform X2 [Eurytemora carolleeae]|eukprot:XP_023323620.1 uncharacterized protein LOC111697745 isoform X2 [Eurytemora affinis]
MYEIGPDLIEWLVADDLVASKWKEIANYLGLSGYIPNIESRRRRTGCRGLRSDRHKLSDLLTLWRIVRRDTFNIHQLLRCLEYQGLKDMYEWIRLMSGLTLSKPEIESLVMRQMNSVTRPTSVRSEFTATTRRPVSQYFSLPNTPRHTPLPSRPISQISFLNESSGFNYSNRSSVSPRRELGAVHNEMEERKQTSKHTGVFETLYRPQYTRKYAETSFSRNGDETLNFTPRIAQDREYTKSPKFSQLHRAVSPGFSTSPSPKFSHQKRDISPQFSPLKRDISPSPLKRDISPQFSPLKRDISPQFSPLKRDISPQFSPLKRDKKSTNFPNDLADLRSKRHSSFISSDYSESSLFQIIENFEDETKYSKIGESNNLQKFRKLGAAKDGGTLTADKYFDNLITLIEEASSSLEI